jgi:hypothetical protein
MLHFEEMTWDDQDKDLTQLELRSANHYGGHPELLLREHLEMDFRELSKRLAAEGWPPARD